MENQNTLSVDEAVALADEKKFFELRKMLLDAEPADIAGVFEKLSPEQATIVFRILPKELAAEVFVEMDPEMQEYLVSRNLGKSVEKEAVISDEAIHSFRRMRCPVKTRRKGTMMIYSAVINPAFPTVVYCMPYCCRLLARNSTQPQHTPPISSGRFGICRFFSRSASGVRWSIRKMQGISTNPPRTLLAKRKAKGPT